MKTNKRIRYIANNYNPKDIDINDILKRITTKLSELSQEMQKYSPPDQTTKIYSNGRKKNDYAIYTGTGGNIYTYWRQYNLTKCNKEFSKDCEQALESFIKSYNTNINIHNAHIKKNIYEYTTSFFQGPVGLYTMGCLVAKETSDEKLFNENLKEVLKFKDVAISDYSEDELLYGNSGYLYSLLLIQVECSKAFKFDFSKEIHEVTLFLYKIGREKQNKHKTDFLIFPFPRNEKDSSMYLGGAHGVIGALYVMLCAISLFPETFKNDSAFQEDLKSSLNNLLSYQFESGNFPSSVNKKEKDELVHFCHGAIGAVYLYSLAYELYKDEKYLNSVLKAGETIWERGLLLKGNGVCHGISGNTYCLHRIYKLTGDTLWKQRMFCFLYATVDENVQSHVKEYIDPQRYLKGVPDAPYSLMEGLAGQLCLYYDILSGDEFIKYPGFQII
jgi:rhamnogalacturonyl hydrolase YesR